MDTATTASEGNPEESEVGRTPSIGVPRIPAQAPPARSPSPVPSVPVPPPPPSGGGPPVATAGTAAGSGVRPEGSGTGGDRLETAFPPGVAAKLGWYVYLLCDPRSGQPVVVGRGRGDRCFDHVRAARPVDAGSDPSNPVGGEGPERGSPRPSSSPDDRGVGFAGLDELRRVEAEDGPVRVEILRYGMSADEAKLAEVVAADALGMPADTKRRSQRQVASELGIRLAKRAKFKREHPVVLLRIGGTGAGDGYEQVRHGWRIGRRWTDPRGTRSPRWAVIVAGELVVGVYRIEGWEPTPLPGPPGPSGSGSRSTYRHSFIGDRDDELEARYLGRSVASYLGVGLGAGAVARPGASTGTGLPLAIGAPNQVAYVWCGPHGADRPG